MENQYLPNSNRYEKMKYRRSGKSGVLLPEISVGLWQNFGSGSNYSNSAEIIRKSFDSGITHFDLANNYGPPPGSAEETFGKILNSDFKSHRDELIISTKAGYDMWVGPYGNWGSRKYLIASLDQSLKRMGLDYVDIFYHHRPDPETPLEETISALDAIIRSGKALYVGISNYPADTTKEALSVLKSLGHHCLIHQAKYSLLERWVEPELLPLLSESGVGLIAFSPLAQGQLTSRYQNGIQPGSRASSAQSTLKDETIKSNFSKIKQLNDLAVQRGQTLSQFSIAWLLKNQVVTSVLIGVSNPDQLKENLESIQNTTFSDSELKSITHILSNQ